MEPEMLSVNFNALKMSSAAELFKLKRLREKMLNCEAFLVKIHFKRKLIDETKFEKYQQMITKILSRISLTEESIDKLGKNSILKEIELLKEVVNLLTKDLKSFKTMYRAANSPTRPFYQISKKKRGPQRSDIQLDITNCDGSQCDSTESSCEKTDDFKTALVSAQSTEKVSINHSITPFGDETPGDWIEPSCQSQEKLDDITTPMATLQIAKEGLQDCPIPTVEPTAKLDTKIQVRAQLDQPVSDRRRKEFFGKVEKLNTMLLELRKTAEKRLYADQAMKESQYEEILESVANISLRTARIELELDSETKNWICNQFAVANKEISEIISQVKN